jgi:hypothetical protein
LQNHKIYFLLFDTIHDVLKADKILKKEKINYELVPVPRNLSSDCGMCVKLEDSLEDAKKHIKDIKTEKCFLFDGKAYVDLE